MVKPLVILFANFSPYMRTYEKCKQLQNATQGDVIEIYEGLRMVHRCALQENKGKSYLL